MEPMSMAIIGMTLFNGATQYFAQRNQGAYAEAMAEINRRMAYQRSKDMLEERERQTEIFQQKVSSMVGTQRAAYGSQGVDVNYGSARDIQKETRELGAKELMIYRNNAYLQAMGVQVEGNLGLSDARMRRQALESSANWTLGTSLVSAYRDYRAGTKDEPTGKKELTLGQPLSESLQMPNSYLTGTAYNNKKSYLGD